MKKEKIIFIVLIVLFSLLFVYSTFNIIKWFIDSSKTNKQIKEIQGYELDNLNPNEIKRILVGFSDVHGNLEAWNAFVQEVDKINLLEINTTPGMTLTSFIPQQVKAAGLKMSDVLTDIVENQF